VLEASVAVDGRMTGAIGEGLLLLAGFGPDDADASLTQMASKVINLRIFEDEQGKMNLSLLDKALPVLAVSQFTLYADCRKGRRPSFTGAATPAQALALYERFVTILRGLGIRTETGEFGAMMRVHLVNWGPVTIVLDSADLGSSRPENDA
jgi:D-tyrosyl-tRNA(Tyr) deacylase